MMPGKRAQPKTRTFRSVSPLNSESFSFVFFLFTRARVYMYLFFSSSLRVDSRARIFVGVSKILFHRLLRFSVNESADFLIKQIVLSLF